MKVSTGILAAALAMAAVGPSAAATLSATPVTGLPYSGFSVGFFDTNGNMRLDFDEISSFSGVTFSPGLDTEVSFNSILGVPDFAGFLAASVSPSVGQTVEQWAERGIWLFSGPSGQGDAFPDFWTYEVTGLTAPAVVPLPAGLPLLLAAIGALMLLRRRAAPV